MTEQIHRRVLDGVGFLCLPQQFTCESWISGFVFVVFNFVEHMRFWFDNSAGDRLAQTSKPIGMLIPLFRYHATGFNVQKLWRDFFFEQKNYNYSHVHYCTVFVDRHNNYTGGVRMREQWTYERTGANSHWENIHIYLLLLFFSFIFINTNICWMKWIMWIPLMRKMRSVVSLCCIHELLNSYLAPFSRSRVEKKYMKCSSTHSAKWTFPYEKPLFKLLSRNMMNNSIIQ